MLNRSTLTFNLISLIIKRYKIQINNSIKEVIYRLYKKEIDRKEILKYLINYYNFIIDLNILKKYLRV